MNGEEVRARLKGAGFKLKDVTDKLGISSQLIQGWLASKDMKVGQLEKIAGAIGKDISFFFPILANDARTKTIHEYLNIPVVNIRAMSGYLIGYGDQDYINSLPQVPVLADQNYKGKYMCFECEGDSMDDGHRHSICHQDVVLARGIKPELWQSRLPVKDFFFVIVHKNGITIKQVTRQNNATGELTCHPLNPMFEDFIIRLDDIMELYTVAQIVHRNIRI